MSSAVLHSSPGATLSTNCWTPLPIDASQEANRYFEQSSAAALPKADLERISDCFLSVCCFVKNFVGVSSGGQSTNSTIAIDTKIEEALDLVKSSLMFAVREEVDVLKEKIDELMNKVNRLEFENSILRAHASSEALSLLQKPHQIAHSSSSSRKSAAFNVYNNNDSNNNKSSSHEL